jgi:hypothetical protein
VTSLLGTNLNGSIYAGSDLPEKFNPALGPGIQIFRAGGVSNPEVPQLINSRVAVKIWADDEQYEIASDLYGAVFDALQGATNLTLADGTILSAYEVTGPAEMTDPETNWVSVYGFFAVMARPN